MAFISQNRTQSAVNTAQIQQGPKSIANRVYRQCAQDGFRARVRHELAGKSTATVPLYSHHATRQSYYSLGWQAVTPLHISKARAKAWDKQRAALKGGLHE
ncbi:hypothetical protein AYI84_04610 [Shewanella algae]|uniref:hypothetical protein n=1 Tax=Shewanella algae TaxID=38313 RepID=UPI0016435691|nr:hypothetical protein [Shewanella algae]MBO2568613.1 hypothetical protein [Shewanella algae]TVL05277.1 hypothetical protein AYI84_04610 [Shewanella algae]